LSCVLLLQRARHHERSAAEDGGNGISTHSNASPTGVAQPSAKTPRSAVPSISSSETGRPPAKASEGPNAQLLSAWQAPIDFYGKAVDEEGNPIAQVNVTFTWSEKPAQDAEKTAQTQTDTQG